MLYLARFSRRQMNPHNLWVKWRQMLKASRRDRRSQEEQ